MANQKCQHKLSSVGLRDLLAPGQTLHTVSSTASVEETLRFLSNQNIYAAPVLDAQTSGPLGLVDLRDIAAYVVHLFASRKGVALGRGEHTVAEFRKADFEDTDVHCVLKTLRETPACNIMDFSRQNAYRPLTIDARLSDVLASLAQLDVGRVPIVDEKGNVVHIVSQSTVVAYLSRNLVHVAPQVQQTILQAHIGTRPVVAIPSGLRAIDAFAMLVEFKLSAVGYMSDGGDDGVSGNISIKDIQGLLLKSRPLLGPVSSYIAMIRTHTTKDTPPLISVHANDPVAKAIQKLTAVGIHRLYLFENGAKYPVGVVALRDILALFRDL